MVLFQAAWWPPRPKAALPSAPNRLIATRSVCPCDEVSRIVGGLFDQFNSFYSFLPSLGGSHQRRPFSWASPNWEGKGGSSAVCRKLRCSPPRRCSSCWYAAGPATQPGPLCAAARFSSLPELLLSLSVSRLFLIFICSPCAVSPFSLLQDSKSRNFCPSWALVQEHRDSLGARSLAES